MDERGLVAFFQDLHAHPELAWEERRTTRKVLEALHARGIETLDTGMETGAIAVVGRQDGPVIGLRCDMDALPLQEETGLPYASTDPGRMHACGHDFHTAAMLGAAILLKEREAELPGRVKIVFQPAEETDGGARHVLATGLLDDAREFYGIHSYPGFPAGTLGIKEGPVMAAPDRFSIRVRGRGAHGAQPHKGVDPIPAAAALVLGAQTLVSRELDPFSPAVVSVTRLQAGTTWNIVPEFAELEGTVRTLTLEDRAQLREALARMARSTAKAYRCDVDFDWRDGSPPVINDAALCAAARDVALDMGFLVDRQEDTMGGEDFSEYLAGRPGVFIRVGTGGDWPAHHPRFACDPAALVPAARFFARLAEDRLREGT